jgi:RDD family protein
MGHALIAAAKYRLADAIMTVAMAIPLNAALIGFTGSSLGKWLFGVRVDSQDGRPIGFGKALLRELSVWVQGMGLGIPVVNVITFWLSYSRLEKNGATPWDEQGHHVVLYRPQGPGQIIGVAVGVVLLLVVAVGARI